MGFVSSSVLKLFEGELNAPHFFRTIKPVSSGVPRCGQVFATQWILVPSFEPITKRSMPPATVGKISPGEIRVFGQTVIHSSFLSVFIVFFQTFVMADCVPLTIPSTIFDTFFPIEPFSVDSSSISCIEASIIAFFCGTSSFFDISFFVRPLFDWPFSFLFFSCFSLSFAAKTALRLLSSRMRSFRKDSRSLFIRFRRLSSSLA
mmetsp:Transcript_17437/g.20184  ORF Transcript_17437/g.20184 Transcript_17437/m.20184 type:complete len:204 (-) Transcript_17437:933-1544(-)